MQARYLQTHVAPWDGCSFSGEIFKPLVYRVECRKSKSVGFPRIGHAPLPAAIWSSTGRRLIPYVKQ